MNKRRLRAPSPALVISLIALFVALGGTSYAAITLPKNSVGTKQLKNGAVTKAKINKKTLTALKGAPGPQGIQGVKGDQGANGLQGLPGPSVGNFTNCPTDTASSTADGAGNGQEQVANCSTTLVVPSAGKLLTTGSGQSTTQYSPCSGGSITQEAAIEIDGNPVNAGLKANISSGFDTELFSMSGGADVAAGSHTVTFVQIGASSGICTAGHTFNFQHAGSVQVVFVEGAS